MIKLVFCIFISTTSFHTYAASEGSAAEENATTSAPAKTPDETSLTTATSVSSTAPVAKTGSKGVTNESIASTTSEQVTTTSTDITKATANEKTPAAASESEIPVNLEAAKAAKTDENPWLKLLMSVSVIGALIAGGYIYLKKSGYKNTILKANQIKILTQFHLGPKKSLAIVRVAGESILIGVTDQNISLIKTLSLLDEEIPETTTHHQFNALLEEQPTTTQFQMPKAAEEEEYAMTGIKNIVSQKIKNMRSI